MKKSIILNILSIVLSIISLSAIYTLSASADESISVCLDGKLLNFDVPPQLTDDRTMVPMRAIFEALGATVDWDEDTQTVLATKNTTTISMTIGEPTMIVNYTKKTLDTAPCVISGRTLIPVRAISEELGTTVQWSQKNNMVVICSKNIYAYADYPDIPDFGKCYNRPVEFESATNGLKTFVYSCYQGTSEYLDQIYDASALILGKYTREVIEETEDNAITISYTKEGETEPKYYIRSTWDYTTGNKIYTIGIPVDENAVILYSLDGRTINVLESEVSLYLNVGWYLEPFITLYAPDERTISVAESEVETYKNVGWYSEPVVTMYAADGRTTVVPKSDIEANKNAGWYESMEETTLDSNWNKLKSLVYDKSKCGSLTGVITYQYNKYIGTRPDVGAKILLVQTNHIPTKNDYLNIGMMRNYKERPDLSDPTVYSVEADGMGNYYFDNIPAGEYYMLIESQKTEFKEDKVYDYEELGLGSWTFSYVENAQEKCETLLKGKVSSKAIEYLKSDMNFNSFEALTIEIQANQINHYSCDWDDSYPK